MDSGTRDYQLMLRNLELIVVGITSEFRFSVIPDLVISWTGISLNQDWLLVQLTLLQLQC